MIFDVRQTESGVSCVYEICKGRERIGSARLDWNLSHGGTIQAAFLSRQYTIEYEPAEQARSWFRRGKERTDLPYAVHCGNLRIGRIYQRFSEGGILKRYAYVMMELGGRDFSIYEVGLGKDGMRYPIYDGETQVALIEKDAFVQDNLDAYRALAADYRAAPAAALLALYQDMRRFANRGEVRHTAWQTKCMLTTNESLKSKHDPGFRERIIEQWRECEHEEYGRLG